MKQAATPTRANRTITVDFQNEAIYFQLLNDGKAFVECVLAQTPPDLVVKFQRLDIVDVILRLVLRPYLVYQREIKR